VKGGRKRDVKQIASDGNLESPRNPRRQGRKLKPFSGLPTVGSSNRGPPNWGDGEKFGRPTKMAAYLEGLLEINFLHPPSKYRDGSPFKEPAGDALNSY